ncbi:3-hydroxyacyl-CoA dehydrogenase [Aeromicrobium sp. SORGH_AS981]|uniref:3-hydroxyacyl-CoA dehydrogenase NAD-binding domain-containing protein n=1 Tax=Aeromicrobium sp. SORGH_AS_0981 TaxID=3041802 RepID=UPI00286550FB|nr:3-hydroxyacyl-CoA dehydrogenase NAD-binding domain-containing protein [Aeromicrobium sp. SORGH_AS_0981]MDR6116836.1 3-hydroxyacyl-CoA dehydrogenase [Aeromicrobium sp. SORGH_AS_0981]
MSDPLAIGVLGGGLMGSGIAEVCARAGHDVLLVEADASARDGGRDRVAASVTRAVEEEADGGTDVGLPGRRRSRRPRPSPSAS